MTPSKGRAAGALAGTRRGSPGTGRVSGGHAAAAMRTSTAPPSRRVSASPPHRVAASLRRFFGVWLLAKVLALAILVAGGGAAAQVAGSSEFHVAEVFVSGSELVAAEDIAATIDVGGASPFAIPSRRMSRLLQADPAIASATVRARLPDSVEVVVHERVPAVLWEASERTLLADETGLTLRDGVRPDLPVIRAPDGPAPDPGGRVDPEVVHLAQSLVPRLEAEGLAGGQLEYRPTIGVSVVLPDSARVALGSPDELEDKLAAYRAIRAHLDQTQTQARFIDVRFLERPYFR